LTIPVKQAVAKKRGKIDVMSAGYARDFMYYIKISWRGGKINERRVALGIEKKVQASTLTPVPTRESEILTRLSSIFITVSPSVFASSKAIFWVWIATACRIESCESDDDCMDTSMALSILHEFAIDNIAPAKAPYELSQMRREI
jgi:hypothetical protein